MAHVTHGARVVQKVEKMSVAVTPEMAGAVRAAVESGEYASTSEVIREALRLWKSHQAARAREVAELRRAWQEGIESGPATTLDFADVKAKARAGLAKERNRTR
jgi:antitoxin ParD1/3/4